MRFIIIFVVCFAMGFMAMGIVKADERIHDVIEPNAEQFEPVDIPEKKITVQTWKGLVDMTEEQVYWFMEGTRTGYLVAEEFVLDVCWTTSLFRREMMSDQQQRPENVTNDHLEYLDNLRGLGSTNMFGAGPYVSREFGIDEEEARGIVAYWMTSFGDKNR